MIHPTNKSERLRVKRIHEEKQKKLSSHVRLHKKDAIRDQETKSELTSYD